MGSAAAGRPYLPHEDEAIRVCLSEGGDLIALAHRLGRSPDALRLHAQHLGLHTRSRVAAGPSGRTRLFATATPARCPAS
jgi:hypothetical protein